MKKFVVLFLILMMIFALVGVCYADNDDNEGNDVQQQITDESTPGSGETVDLAVYDEDEEYEEYSDEETPGSNVTVEIQNEEIPAGGVPAEVFYAAGGLFVAAAGVLTFARKK